ncbi:MAG: aspartate kinase, partial [Deltaproteobacteria bacterium]|nr:aspartate kinase [Deltaproteobacteria bacterium]
AALQADSCEIYTDVDGIYTADPRWVPAARKLDRMAYEELLEMAGAGAKVVQMRSVQLAARYEVPLHVRSALRLDRSGTTVVREDPRMEATLVSGVTHTINEAKIAVRRIPDRPGVAARLFDPLARANINVDMIVQTIDTAGNSEIGFTVAKEDLKKTLQLTEPAARAIGAAQVEAAGDVSKVSIIGVGMRSHAGVAAKLFEVLAGEQINILLISTSEIKVSVVIDMPHAKRAVSALHAAFGLDEKAP